MNLLSYMQAKKGKNPKNSSFGSSDKQKISGFYDLCQ